MNRRVLVAIGVLLTLGEAALWHGPLGAADRFDAAVAKQSRTVLDDWEMFDVDARLAHRPLRRTLILAGPADDFQRRELPRIMIGIRGVGSVRWVDSPQPMPPRLPLIAEAELYALAGFGLGLLVAYLLELRRRYRAEWRW